MFPFVDFSVPDALSDEPRTDDEYSSNREVVDKPLDSCECGNCLSSSDIGP